MIIDFTFDGRKIPYLKLKKSNHLNGVKKSREFIKVPGRTGDLVIEDGSFENREITLECYIDVPENKSITDVSEELDGWLNSPIGYRELAFSDGCSFKAVNVAEIEFESCVDKVQEITLQFSAYKER